MKIEASLADELRENRNDALTFPVIITFKNSQGLQVLNRLGIQPTVVYKSIAAAAALVSSAGIEALASSPEVASIELDQTAGTLGPR